MRRSRAFSVAAAVGMALILVLSMAVTSQGAVAKKTYEATLTPSSVNTESTTEYTLTVKNTATTQTLGSCNLTAPSGFTLVAVTQQPQDPATGATFGTASIAAPILQLRNLSTPPNGGVRQTKFTAKAPGTAGPYTWAIECRQANNYSPDQPSNRFTTKSTLVTNVVTPTPEPTPDFSVAFVDTDGDANNDSTETPDPLHGGGDVRYVARVSNTGTGAGSPSLTDSTSEGGIQLMDPCTSTTGDETSQSRTCSLGSIAPGGFVDVTIVVRLTSISSEHQITNTVSVGSSTDTEETTVTPSSGKCDGFDCVVTWYEPSLGLDVTTGPASSDNPLSWRIQIPAVDGAPVGGELRTFKDLFDEDGCGENVLPRPCGGTNETGNMFDFGLLPEACGLSTEDDRLCTLTIFAVPNLLFETTPDGCKDLCVGYWEDDTPPNGTNFAIPLCDDAVASDLKCEDSRAVNGSTITFVILGSFGDGRTGYCLGKICP